MTKIPPVVPTVLSVILIALAFGSVAHASPEVAQLTVGPPMYVAKALGESFAVDINVLNAQNLRAFEFKVGYNTTLLDALGVVQGSFFPSSLGAVIEEREINETMGFVYLRVSISGSEPAVSGSGALATITFDVTFAPTLPAEAYCVIDLYDTSLYDGLMTTIAHDSTDGLYFWKSIQPDPPVEGRLLDLTTQRGGIGQGVSGGNFTLGEVVELYAKLTYNDFPVAGKLVVFTVLNSQSELFTVLQGITDINGSVKEGFRIPFISGSIGEWMVTASADVAEKVVWDSLTFEVTYEVSPHGPKASFTESRETPYVGEVVEFDASESTPGWNGTSIMPITEYRWNFGDGNTTTTSTPVIKHAYKYAGIYYVTLTVYAPNAAPETDTAPFQRKDVLAAPVAPVGGYSYSVSIGNSTTATPSVLYSALMAIAVIVFALVRCKTSLRRRLR